MKTFSISLILKRNTITILFLMFFSFLAFCQKGMENCFPDVSDTSIYEENIAGEPFYLNEIYLSRNFYNDDWQYGTIFLENGKTIYNKILNYHLLTHKLIWIRSSDKGMIAVEKATVKEFILPSNDSSINKSLFRKLKFRTWDVHDSVEEFLQVLSQGYINLYVFRKSIVGKYSSRVYPEDDYYLQVNNENIKRLKLLRKSLYSAVGEHDLLMKNIIRSNHLKIRKEYALIKAVTLFNQEIKKANN
jgi:hypothetical protein